jgi:DNA-binding Lrp family transcriptional regulator
MGGSPGGRKTASSAYLLKVWARDLPHLEYLLNQEIKTMSGVIRTEALIVLSSSKDQVTGLAAQAAR